MTNRVVVDKPLTLQSVMGRRPPGLWASRFLESSRMVTVQSDTVCPPFRRRVLSGFTLTNGATRTSGDLVHEQKGGAVWCASLNEVVTNCVLAHNSACALGGGAYGGTLNHCTVNDNLAYQGGGGVYGSTLNGCVLTGNAGTSYGGGAYIAVLNNCTVTSNTASYGGGAYNSWLSNCIVYFNTTPGGGS